MEWLAQSALAEAAGGATAGVIADSTLYGIDSWKVRVQQSKSTGGSIRDLRILFRGLGPTVLLGSVPVFGGFFLIYAPTKTLLQHHQRPELIPLASAACAIPSTIIGVPADILKKRMVLGMDKTFLGAVVNATKEHGALGLFVGWNVNLARDIPFAGLKIGLFELFVHRYMIWNGLDPRDHISPTGAAICGILSGVCCAFLTSPLDVCNTYIKAGRAGGSTSIPAVSSHIVKTEGITALFRGVALRSFVLGVGSSIFWPIQRRVAHSLEPSGRFVY
ncbi:unnamed protein product [Cylindrotheca closterium]|uniref:Mitochondrial carrier protein n=1 Tax=Cylindrotheca closterium TaxID=2856 RepID=A0AAD2FWJ3_9STRA|nr:unnamed protein product [Cylindrotheca closterium]